MNPVWRNLLAGIWSWILHEGRTASKPGCRSNTGWLWLCRCRRGLSGLQTGHESNIYQRFVYLLTLLQGHGWCCFAFRWVLLYCSHPFPLHPSHTYSRGDNGREIGHEYIIRRKTKRLKDMKGLCFLKWYIDIWNGLQIKSIHEVENLVGYKLVWMK